MRFPPEVYFIGAPKAGTSTMAYLLNQHPQITVAVPKEPQFFTLNWDKGLDWYRDKFPGSPDSVLVDASTTYSMAPLKSNGGKKFEGIPRRVFSVNPHARFIYSLRDPVERTYSGYWHGVRIGFESRKFGAAIRDGSLQLDVSDYHGQLSLWLEYFPLDSFHFVLFEDMKESPEHAARECFEFILGEGADVPSVRLDSIKNRSWMNSRVARMNRAKRRIGYLIERSPGLARSLTPLRPMVPKAITSGVNKVMMVGSKPIPPMKKEDRDFLVEYFYQRNRDLERLIGVSLDKWQA